MSSVLPKERPPRAIRANHRTRHLTMEGAYDVAARVRALEANGRRVANLSIGEPSWATPAHITDAAMRALRNGETRYTPVAGIAPLREAISGALQGRGIAADADNVIVTPGAKPALFYGITALVDPGDEVLLPDPGFPAYASIAAFAGAVPVGYDASGVCGADVDDIAARISPRTRVLVLNSPANPSGGTLDRASLRRIVELAAQHDLLVISDECYGRLVYDGSIGAPSIAALPGMSDRTLVVDSFSKTYAMTGWRLGFIHAPSRVARVLQRFAVNVQSCTPAFVQRAGIAALTGPQGALDRMRNELRGRRDVLVHAVASLPGVSCRAPAGAFYVFADVSRAAARAGRSTDEYADWLLNVAGVAGVSGTAFGARGNGHIRFSFAAPTDQIALGIERLQHALQSEAA